MPAKAGPYGARELCKGSAHARESGTPTGHGSYAKVVPHARESGTLRGAGVIYGCFGLAQRDPPAVAGRCDHRLRDLHGAQAILAGR